MTDLSRLTLDNVVRRPHRESGRLAVKLRIAKKVLFKNDETGCSDVAIDPNNPNMLYLGLLGSTARLSIPIH